MRSVHPSSTTFDTCGGRSFDIVQVHSLSAHDTYRAAMRYAIALIFSVLILNACNSIDGPDEDTLAYRSIWIELYPDSMRSKLSEDTLQGAFYFAAAANTQATAEQRWAKNLSAWGPAHGEFEDAMHANLVTWADLEMQRLQYLKQKNPTAVKAVNDKLLKLAAEYE